MALELPAFDDLRKHVAANVWASSIFAEPFEFRPTSGPVRTVWGHMQFDQALDEEGTLESRFVFRCLVSEVEGFEDRGYISHILVHDQLQSMNRPKERPYYFTGDVIEKTQVWQALEFRQDRPVYRRLNVA